MTRFLAFLLLAAALPARANNSKGGRMDTHVMKSGPLIGQSERTVGDSLALPGDVTRVEMGDQAATLLDHTDFSEVLALQDQLSAALAESTPNPEIAGTKRLHDALSLRSAAEGRSMRPASLPRTPGDVNWDGVGERSAAASAEARAAEESGFYDVVGRARHEGQHKRFTVGKGVQVDERTLEQDGRQLIAQDIAGSWPQEFFMTRVFFFQKDAGGKVIVSVKTDGEGALSDGKPEDYQAQLQWWRERLKKPSKTK